MDITLQLGVLVSLLLSLFTACTEDILNEETCVRSSTRSVAGEFAVSAHEVWEAIAGFQPTQVEWVLSPTQPSSDVSFGYEAVAGDPALVRYDGPTCRRQGRALYVPVRWTLGVAAGEIQATIDGGIEAFGVDAADLAFPVPQEGPATLSAAWQQAALESPDATAPEPTSWTLSLFGTLKLATISVNGRTERSVADYWSGTLSDYDGTD